MSKREEVLRLSDRLAAERRAARPVVATLHDRLAAAWDADLPSSWQTVGMVQELVVAADDTLEKDPSLSRDLAQFAVAVATAIAPRTYPRPILAQAEGQAWRQVGVAHRYMSNYAAAIRALDAAHRIVAGAGVLQHDEAIVELARAVVFNEQNRHDEALRLVKELSAVFAEFGDQRRSVQCSLVEGMIYQRRGELRAARTTYEDALSVAKQTDDLHTIGAILLNLAQVYSALGEVSMAAAQLQEARELFAGLQMPTEVTRTDFALGRVLVEHGQHLKAIGILRSVRERFLERRMIEEAGLAALDMVDALVATDDRKSAQVLTETVILEFRAAGLNERALTALAYLRDLLPTHPTPQQPIRHVRSYLEQLRTEHVRAFLPLPE